MPALVNPAPSLPRFAVACRRVPDFADGNKTRAAEPGCPVRDFADRKEARAAVHGGTVCGFTLVEMIISILIVSILAVFVVSFITSSVQGYTDVARRATLVDATESALRRLGRDIRVALPNSVRINANTGGTTSFAVELVPILDGAKYSNKGAAADKLVADASDSAFTLVGCLRNPAARNVSGTRMVVNNGATASDDVYSNASLGAGVSSVITAAAVTISITPATCTAGTNDAVTFAPAHQFRGDSPALRIYVVTTPVSYLCDATSGTLTRYEGYAISSNQPLDPGSAPLSAATSALLVNRIAECTAITTTANVAARRLATFALTLSEEGDVVRLIYQVPLDNSR